MRFDPPEVARCWPPTARVIHVARIGQKCCAAVIPDPEGTWLEAGGICPPGYSEEMLAHAREVFDGVAPEGPLDLDVKQARIYFRKRKADHGAECRIILPDDFPFRSSRKGLVIERSKSFDREGNPVSEVLLLYALKTGRLADRVRAVEAFEHFFWGAATYGEMFDAMDDVTRTHENFFDFVGRKLAAAAFGSNKLSDWSLWEQVAESAAAMERERAKNASRSDDNHSHSQFLKAVKDAAIEFEGLPAQIHVRERWEKNGGKGVWKDIRKTLGFDWLPTKAERGKLIKASRGYQG